MKTPEAHYINAGHRYEQARTPGQVATATQIFRTYLEAEHPTDHAEARRLFDLGRQEARQ